MSGNHVSSCRGPVPVAFITTTMGIGGAERMLFDLIGRLDRSLFRPVLVCLKEPMSLGEQLARRGVSVHGRLLRGRMDVAVISRLARVLRREGVQVACTVGTGGDRSFWGRLAARWAGVPVVISCPHSMGLPDHFEPHNRMLTGITDAFVAVAKRQKLYLARSQGLPAAKIHVIHNGVDLERFTPRESNGEFRQRLGIPLDAPVAGVVACLRPEKNLGLFLDAAACVHDQLPHARYLIIGDGPQRKKLESLARDLGIDQCVHFAGLCSDVRDGIAAMDVVMLTSLSEAFPISLLEAMASARPVIATRVGAIPEMVVHNEGGLLVPPNDCDSLAAAMTELLADPTRCRQMGQSARAFVQQRFDVRTMVRGYERLFARLLTMRLSAELPRSACRFAASVPESAISGQRFD
jgi:glycosyltransferase involved in cell wall biosynthesis